MISNELRVGNYVAAGAGIVKVETIPDKEYWRYFEGVPLTPEILEKAGFVNTGNENQCMFYALNSVELYINGSDCVFDFTYAYRAFKFGHTTGLKKNIMYLHQLQNLYFALTGEELEINLFG